jgi:hypothetical protein
MDVVLKELREMREENARSREESTTQHESLKKDLDEIKGRYVYYKSASCDYATNDAIVYTSQAFDCTSTNNVKVGFANDRPT